MFTQALMLGGGKRIKSALRGPNTSDQLMVVLLLVLLFVLRALVVQWAYNKVGPKLIHNMGHSTDQFRPLTYEEALVFTLLITFLVY
jgi:hypothetical protein